MDPLRGQAGLVVSGLEGASPASNLKIKDKPLSSDPLLGIRPCSEIPPAPQPAGGFPSGKGHLLLERGWERRQPAGPSARSAGVRVPGVCGEGWRVCSARCQLPPLFSRHRSSASPQTLEFDLGQAEDVKEEGYKSTLCVTCSVFC